MASVQALERLRALYLLKTGITDKGLADLKPLDGLRTLYVTGTKVSADGAAAVRRRDAQPPRRAAVSGRTASGGVLEPRAAPAYHERTSAFTAGERSHVTHGLRRGVSRCGLPRTPAPRRRSAARFASRPTMRRRPSPKGSASKKPTPASTSSPRTTTCGTAAVRVYDLTFASPVAGRHHREQHRLRRVLRPDGAGHVPRRRRAGHHAGQPARRPRRGAVGWRRTASRRSSWCCPITTSAARPAAR